MDAPFEVRVGSTGVGVFIGCGAGVGFLTPVSLHSIPLVGQMSSSISHSILQLDRAVGGWGRKLGGMVNANMGRWGINAGVGCGVAIGYGWGAGLMLKPSALSSLADAIKSRIPMAAAFSHQNNTALNTKDFSGNFQQWPSEVKVAAQSPPPPPPPTSQPALESLEKEVTGLTKLVLQQQVAVQDIKKQLALLQETLAAPKRKGR